jgi:O-antigen/teichoic acid export membrane protein
MDFRNTYGRGKLALSQLLARGTLRAKAIRGGAWLGAGSVVEQASRFARNMLLTRLLAPSAFGAMAIVMSSSSIIGALTEVGLKQAIIHNPRGAEKAYLNAGWWMGLGRAISAYVVIFALAPFVAHFYGITELSGLLRVALLGTLFDGAMSPHSILPQKEMKFGRWMAISNGGALCGITLTVILSFVMRDVWALAIGFSSENAFRCILSYIVCPGLPSLRWDFHAMRDLYGYSKDVFGLPILNLIFSRADIFVLGKLYSTTALGLYSMGVSLVLTPSIFVINVLAQILLPSFAHVQGDKERVNRILVEITSWLILLGLPGVVAIYLCGHSLLRVLYGVRYMAAAAPLAVAACVVFLNILNAAITCVFAGVGRPALHRRAVAASAVVILIVIYPACRLLGIVGGQVAALVAILASYLLQVMRMRGLTGLNMLRYGKAFAPALVVSGGVLGVGLGARALGLATRPLANIAFGVYACVIAYALCVPAFLKIKQTA